MSLTVSEVEASLGRYAGHSNVFLSRLNEVCARLQQSGNWRKEEITLPVYSDAQGVSIVSVPRSDTILAGALTTSNVLCAGDPMGVRNGWAQFNPNGLGYGGLTQDFTEVFGEFAVFNEWTDPMRIRLRPEVSETGNVYLSGTLNGRAVWALNGATWEGREKVPFAGNDAVTSVQYFDVEGFKAKKPVTNGRVFVYALDDANEESLIAIWEPNDTLPRYKRYRVPLCEDVSPVTETSITPVADADPVTQVAMDALFSAADDITVNTTDTTELSYPTFYSKTVRIIAQAGTYTHTFALGALTPKSGAVMRVSLEVAADAGITLDFRDGTAGGTQLQIVNGDSSNAFYATLVFSFSGSAWRYAGREV